MLEHLHDGEKPPEKMRVAKNSDKLLVSRSVDVLLPGGGPVQPLMAKMLWQVTGDEIWIELTERNLRYVLASLSSSAPAVKKVKQVDAKASPKKRRKLKKRISQPQEEPPEEEQQG